MELFAESIPVSTADAFVQRFSQHITMLLTPRRICDFGNNGFDQAVGRIETKIKADRIEAVPEVTKMCQQANRPGRPMTRLRFHKVAHVAIQRDVRIAQVVAPTKPGHVGSVG